MTVKLPMGRKYFEKIKRPIGVGRELSLGALGSKIGSELLR